MKIFSSFLFVFSLVFGAIAESSQYNQDLILTLPTGDFKVAEFVEKVEDLNPFLNIVTKGAPKASEISFSSGSRFKTVFRNLSQFQNILKEVEETAGGAPKFELLEDRLTIVWSKGAAAPASVAKKKGFSAPVRDLSDAYRINGTLVIDEYLKYDPKTPVVVDGEVVVGKEAEFGELHVNGRLTLMEGTKIKAEKLTITGEVVVLDGATVETVDVVFNGEGDLVLNGDSTLLLNDSTISSN